MKKKFLVIMMFLFVWMININSFAEEKKLDIVYFKLKSCSVCSEVKLIINDLEKKYPNINVITYEIDEKINMNLFELYNNKYNVKGTDRLQVPMIFVKDKFYEGKKDIEDNLEKVINDKSNTNETVIMKLSAENEKNPRNKNSTTDFLGYLLAALINGLNPCSLSMFLFLFTAINLKKNDILKITFSFSLAKFIMYFLLGCVFYFGAMKLNLEWFSYAAKILSIVFILFLLILNISDFINARKGNIKNIKNQLPKGLRKFNHNIMKTIIQVMDTKTVIATSFLIGMIISIGEFMCTGQIYMVSIYSITYTNLNIFLYFLIYDIVFVLPLLVIGFIIYKGKGVATVSDFIATRIHLIKLLNVILFTGFLIYILMEMF